MFLKDSGNGFEVSDAGKIISVKAGTTNQGSVDIRLSHKTVNIAGLHAAAIEDARCCRGLRIVEFSQESAYEGVDFLGLLVGCDFPGADRPHRLVSDHDSLHLSGCEVLQASGNLLTEDIEHLAAFPLFQGFTNTENSTKAGFC